MERKPLINRDYRYFESNTAQKPKRNPLPKFSFTSKYTLIPAGIVLGIISVVLAKPNQNETAFHQDVSETSQFVTSEIKTNLVANAGAQTALPSPMMQTSQVDAHTLALAPSLTGSAVSTSTPKPKPAPTRTEADWETLKVKSGDTFGKLISRAGLSPRQVHELVSTDKNTKKLTKIFPGDVFKVQINDQGELARLSYEIDDMRKLEVSRNKEGKLSSEIIQLPVDIQRKFAQGTIESSLFLAAQKAGLPDKTTMELANIFGWDIDFALDIREDDSFSVLYEELYRDGKKLKNGAIIAAEFTNKGRKYQAIRFETSDGFASYYSPDGSSMRKTFLRTPVEFSRISSRFSLNRKHPILNKIRSHKGVDYAAPRGTPIRATGDGKVTFRGRKGGYGKTIILQHGSKYSTLYAHLNGYAKGSRSGQKVRQGQIIGYIGSTGLATGPHLHYEFRVNGVHRNPLTVKFPTAEPLAKKYMGDFKQVADRMLAQIETHKKTRLALGRN